MSKFELKAEVRESTGKEKAKKLRAEGFFPAIVYGTDKGPSSLTLNIREVELLIARTHGEKVLVDLIYEGKTEKVFVRNVQRDPVNEKLIHVDFYRVDLDKEIDTWVPVIHVGNPYGVRMGGILESGVRQLHIRALPMDVPPHVEVSVENLNIGGVIHAGDIDLGEKVALLTSPDAVLFAIHGKTVEEPVAAVAAP